MSGPISGKPPYSARLTQLNYNRSRESESEQFPLLRGACLFRRADGPDPFRGDWRHCCCIEVAVNDPSIRVRSLPLGDERSG